MTCTAALFLLATLAPAQQTELQVIDHTLGEAPRTALQVDLARGHRVSLRTLGTPGDRVFLFASTTPMATLPSARPGRAVLVDTSRGVLLVDGVADASAVIGPAGYHDFELLVPEDAAIGNQTWFKGMTMTWAGKLAGTGGFVGEVVQAHVFEFESGPQGWVGGFADYPAGEEEFYELEWDHSPLPAPLDPTRSGLRMQGNNHSDDLFMFLKRQVGGLQPGEVYRVDVEVEVASQYPASWLGVGGAPGSGVYLHGGGTTVEPIPVVEPVSGWYLMNIDKGNQAMPGTQSQVLGHIGIAGEVPVYTIVKRKTSTPVEATASASGKLWLHIGTDSAFESLTEVWYDRLVFRIRK